MLWWTDYKKFKAEAERLIKSGAGNNMFITNEISDFHKGKQDYGKTVENIINILSNGEHYKPFHDFKKIGDQQKLDL